MVVRYEVIYHRRGGAHVFKKFSQEKKARLFAEWCLKEPGNTCPTVKLLRVIYEEIPI